MATTQIPLIPCTDYFEDVVDIIQIRIKRTDPNSIKNRHANFVYSMDLSPMQSDDELGNQYGAWSLWDLTVTHACQYVDNSGNDMILVAIRDRVYVLDWTVYRDEFLQGVYAPIYRMLTIGPLPSSLDDAPKGYALDALKRFREVQWSLMDEPQAGNDSKWRVSVGEYNHTSSYRTTVRQQKRAMRIPMAVKGPSFVLRLEHTANEPMRIEHVLTKWDLLGRPIKNSTRVY